MPAFIRESSPQPEFPLNTDHRYAVGLGISAMMIVISGTLVALRFISRHITKPIGCDDWFCLMSLIFAYGMLVTTALSGTVGRAGFHITEDTTDGLAKFYKITLANRIIYLSALSTSKLSILLFLRRIFSVKRSFNVAVWVVFGLVAIYWIGSEISLIFEKGLNPIIAQWRSWLPIMEFRGVEDGKFWMAMGIINIVLDFIILCLPQSMVWKLRMDTKRKIQVSVVLCLGFFACISSIVRIISLAGTFSALPLIWTFLEVHLSIICSCLPLMPGLIRHYRGKSELSSQATGWPSNYNNMHSPRYSQSQLDYPLYQSLELRAKSSQDSETGLIHGLSPNVS